MGVLVDGIWQDETSATESKGRFVRQPTRFRNWVTPDGSPGPTGEGGFAAEPGRYHLYVSLACPWAHRTLIFRQLKRLDDVISLATVAPLMGAEGMGVRRDARDRPATRVNGAQKLADVYLLADARYSGRVTRTGAVGQEAAHHRQQRVGRDHPHVQRGLRRFHRCEHRLSIRPTLRAEIDRINDLVYANINNGVYRAGFATTQDAYEEAFLALFAALDEIEALLSRRRYLAGAQPHRGRLAPVHHLDPLRRGLLFALQMQSAPHRRLPEPLELSARALSGARRSPRP